MVLLDDLGFSAGDLLAGRRPGEGLDVSSIYAKGWLLTHFLAFEPSRPGQLNRYLNTINEGVPAEKAAVSAFGDLRKLDGEIDRYARSRTFPAFRVAPGPAPQVAVRPLSAGESAIMRIRIRSDRGASGKRSTDIVSDARRIATAHAGDAFVQGVLAEAEFDVRNYAGAIAAADRALAIDPGQIQALTYKDRALMELGRADPAKADWPTVRRL